MIRCVHVAWFLLAGCTAPSQDPSCDGFFARCESGEPACSRTYVLVTLSSGHDPGGVRYRDAPACLGGEPSCEAGTGEPSCLPSSWGDDGYAAAWTSPYGAECSAIAEPGQSCEAPIGRPEESELVE